MRRLVTGVDGSGRSCVVDETEFSFGEAMPGVAVDQVFETQLPPPTRPDGHGDFLDLGVPPGTARWLVLEFGPGGAAPMHYTDTCDFDVVLSGTMELTLDDGVHRLEPGDCVVMNGVDHGWKAGPEGCRLGVVLLGTPPP